MSDPIDLSRRDVLVRIGASVSLAAMGENVLPAQEAEHVHHAVAGDKAANQGTYRPRALTAHEYATLKRLTDLNIPADDRSPGALEAGAANYIDFLCSVNQDLKEIYTGGLAWLDDAMRRDHTTDFVTAQPVAQTAMLDRIAYRRNASAELNPGVAFFSWVRNMTVDAYYTTPAGVKEVGFMGNGVL